MDKANFQVVALLLLLVTLASSFTSMSSSSRRASTLLRDSMGNIEQIEFKIFPDGRVEETVRGIKGGNCHQVTDKINEQLGKVVESAPTEEMFEQDITIDQTLVQTEGESWEGSSSW